ncbi:(E2-independent) E3 ubiquitin-conjugating enzyme FATS isoform X1 [Melozone crissalis]|uniref:(E2-independent) E3 ubiquitin-conjugating enzyme FATS isoform X1 n=2 Tax=Melozone crissalis TaxID=40204 RepID=UPI0023DCC0DC|nr:(E2-independent) E3 ubiquitin-conjugating enzyme FATS isoform X1 [Melozone crissalis]
MPRPGAQPSGTRIPRTPAWSEPRIWGMTQKRWGPDGQRTCTGLQWESSVWGKSSPTKESLPSQNTTLISPVITAQIDEEKPSVPMQALLPQPRAPHTEPPLPTQGSAIVSRTFLVLPSRLEIQASLEDTMSPSDSPSPKQCPGQQRGFASITVTARRVPVGSGELAGGPGAGQEPSTVSPTPSTVPALLERWPPPAHAIQPPLKASKSCSRLGEGPQKQLFDPGIKEDGVGLQSSDGREKIPPSFISCVQLQVCEPCPNTIYYLDRSLSVCIDQPRVKCQKLYRSTLSLSLKCSLSGLTADGVDGIANGEPMEETAPRKLPGAHGAPLRSHLSSDFTGNKVIKEEKTEEGHLGRKYPLQSVFASGLAAFVDIPRGPHKAAAAEEEDEQPGSHHTVLSLQIPHSSNEAGTPMLLGSRKRSSTTTPGSLPFAASRETIAAAPDGSSNRADPSKDPSKPKEIQAQGVLKPKMSVSNSTCNVKASSGMLWEENVHRQQQLLKSNYEFPAPRDRAEELEAQDKQGWRVPLSRVPLSRVPLSRVTLSRVSLSRARSPGVAWDKNLLTWPEPRSQQEKTPAAPCSLREALELHNPQFISRSQQRLKRLELMVQLRRAQHREAPPGTPRARARKLSTSTSSRKRQFTIPDPLSDNLFKPKERVIPEREMHMRSKRIYDNLPEVKKKQEEKQKRIIIQSNRLRVEMFKKQLLDQLLHRNTE